MFLFAGIIPHDVCHWAEDLADLWTYSVAGY